LCLPEPANQTMDRSGRPQLCQEATPNDALANIPRVMDQLLGTRLLLDCSLQARFNAPA